MKNKKTAYLLVPLVLFVWGMIGWKIYAAVNPGEIKNNEKANTEKTNDPAKIIPDTFGLVANYRDPFLDKNFSRENSKIIIKNKNLPVVKNIEVVKPDIKWPEVAYHGLIMRNNSEKKIGFLSVNGASYFVQEGENAAGMKIGRLAKDSIEVLLGKERRIVRKAGS
jgi:hypothetical protein